MIFYPFDALIPGINPGRELPGTRYQQQGLFWSPAFYLKSREKIVNMCMYLKIMKDRLDLDIMYNITI